MTSEYPDGFPVVVVVVVVVTAEEEEGEDALVGATSPKHSLTSPRIKRCCGIRTVTSVTTIATDTTNQLNE